MDPSDGGGGTSDIPVWLEGTQRWVTGLTKRTTCDDVIYALLYSNGLHETQSTDSYAIFEKWREVERPLSSRTKLVKVWHFWGQEQSNVQLSMRHVDDYFFPGDSSLYLRGRRRHKRSSRLKTRHASHGHGRHTSKRGCVECTRLKSLEQLVELVVCQERKIKEIQDRIQHTDRLVVTHEARIHQHRVEHNGLDYVQDSYLNSHSGSSSSSSLDSSVFTTIDLKKVKSIFPQSSWQDLEDIMRMCEDISDMEKRRTEELCTLNQQTVEVEQLQLQQQGVVAVVAGDKVGKGDNVMLRETNDELEETRVEMVRAVTSHISQEYNEKELDHKMAVLDQQISDKQRLMRDLHNQLKELEEEEEEPSRHFLVEHQENPSTHSAQLSFYNSHHHHNNNHHHHPHHQQQQQKLHQHQFQNAAHHSLQQRTQQQQQQQLVEEELDETHPLHHRHHHHHHYDAAPTADNSLRQTNFVLFHPETTSLPRHSHYNYNDDDDEVGENPIQQNNPSHKYPLQQAFADQYDDNAQPSAVHNSSSSSRRNVRAYQYYRNQQEQENNHKNLLHHKQQHQQQQQQQNHHHQQQQQHHPHQQQHQPQQQHHHHSQNAFQPSHVHAPNVSSSSPAPWSRESGGSRSRPSNRGGQRSVSVSGNRSISKERSKSEERIRSQSDTFAFKYSKEYPSNEGATTTTAHNRAKRFDAKETLSNIDHIVQENQTGLIIHTDANKSAINGVSTRLSNTHYPHAQGHQYCSTNSNSSNAVFIKDEKKNTNTFPKFSTESPHSQNENIIANSAQKRRQQMLSECKQGPNSHIINTATSAGTGQQKQQQQKQQQQQQQIQQHPRQRGKEQTKPDHHVTTAGGKQAWTNNGLHGSSRDQSGQGGENYVNSGEFNHIQTAQDGRIPSLHRECEQRDGVSDQQQEKNKKYLERLRNQQQQQQKQPQQVDTRVQTSSAWNGNKAKHQQHRIKNTIDSQHPNDLGGVNDGDGGSGGDRVSHNGSGSGNDGGGHTGLSVDESSVPFVEQLGRNYYHYDDRVTKTNNTHPLQNQLEKNKNDNDSPDLHDTGLCYNVRTSRIGVLPSAANSSRGQSSSISIEESSDNNLAEYLHQSQQRRSDNQRSSSSSNKAVVVGNLETQLNIHNFKPGSREPIVLSRDPPTETGIENGISSHNQAAMRGISKNSSYHNNTSNDTSNCTNTNTKTGNTNNANTTKAFHTKLMARFQRNKSNNNSTNDSSINTTKNASNVNMSANEAHYNHHLQSSSPNTDSTRPTTNGNDFNLYNQNHSIISNTEHPSLKTQLRPSGESNLVPSQATFNNVSNPSSSSVNNKPRPIQPSSEDASEDPSTSNRGALYHILSNKLNKTASKQTGNIGNGSGNNQTSAASSLVHNHHHQQQQLNSLSSNSSLENAQDSKRQSSNNGKDHQNTGQSYCSSTSSSSTTINAYLSSDDTTSSSQSRVSADEKDKKETPVQKPRERQQYAHHSNGINTESQQTTQNIGKSFLVQSTCPPLDLDCDNRNQIKNHDENSINNITLQTHNTRRNQSQMFRSGKSNPNGRNVHQAETVDEQQNVASSMHKQQQQQQQQQRQQQHSLKSPASRRRGMNPIFCDIATKSSKESPSNNHGRKSTMPSDGHTEGNNNMPTHPSLPQQNPNRYSGNFSCNAVSMGEEFGNRNINFANVVFGDRGIPNPNQSENHYSANSRDRKFDANKITVSDQRQIIEHTPKEPQYNGAIVTTVVGDIGGGGSVSKKDNNMTSNRNDFIIPNGPGNVLVGKTKMEDSNDSNSDTGLSSMHSDETANLETLV